MNIKSFFKAARRKGYKRDEPSATTRTPITVLASFVGPGKGLVTLFIGDTVLKSSYLPTWEAADDLARHIRDTLQHKKIGT